MKLDFYCKVSTEGKLSSSDEDRVIKIMREGGLCILPSDSSYILTGYIMVKGVAEDIDFILERQRADMSLAFHSYSQFSEIFKLSDKASRFIHKFMPGGLTFVSQPKEDVIANHFARKLNTDGTIGIRLSNSIVETQLARDFPIPTTPIRKADQTETATLKDALEIISKRYAQLSKYRRLAAVDGPVLRCGNLSTVVTEEKMNGDEYIVILREGIISKDTIQSAAAECGYNGAAIKDKQGNRMFI